MIRELNAHQMIELYGAVLPMAVLLVRDDDDRAFLSETYLQYRTLMYKIASDYFKPDVQAIEEVMSEAVERLCRYCEQIHVVPCNKRPAYLVRLVENVCRTRLRRLMLEKDHYAFSLDDAQSEPLPAQENVEETVFSHFYAEELLAMLDRAERQGPGADLYAPCGPNELRRNGKSAAHEGRHGTNRTPAGQAAAQGNRRQREGGEPT